MGTLQTLDGAVRQVPIAFVVSIFSALILMPLAISVGKRFKFAAEPRLFGKHGKTIPYLGGIALSVAALGGFAVALGRPNRTLPLFIAGFLLMILGLIDDSARFTLGPRTRLLLQFGIATGVWFVGLGSDTGGLLGGVGSVVFLVAAMNAFNLLDNMDGVAGWTGVGTSAGISGIALLEGQVQLAALALAICGACLGFLKYNLPRARIYLGNGGSLFLGFFIAASALDLKPSMESPWGLLAVIVLLAVPIADTSVAIMSRLLHQKPLMSGGTDHISHRLVRLGLSSGKAAMAHGLASLVAAGAVTAAILVQMPQLLVGAVALFAVAGLLLLGVSVYGTERKGGLRRLVIAGGLIIIAAVLLAVPSSLAAKERLEQARADMVQGAAAIRALDFPKARSEFSSAERNALRAEKHLESPLTWPARGLPIAKNNLLAVRSVASGASFLIPAIRDGVSALEPLSKQGPGGVDFANGTLSLEPIVRGKQRLAHALAGARLGLKRVGAQERFLIPPVADARERFLDEGRRAVEGFQTAHNAAGVLPTLLGSAEPRTYFLMIQNATEQRATGGFLGAFGILRAEGGHLSLERLESDIALPDGDPVAAPSAEFATRYDRFESQRTWQNVNMTPDFPTAAGMVAEMWQTRTNQKVDGVMAVDSTALADLLKVVGPVSVTGWPEPVTSKNFVRVALSEAYVRFPDKPDREDFLLGAGREIWGKLLGPGEKDVKILAGSLGRAMSSKHMQIWTRAEARQLKRLGVDGSLRAAKDSDYLLVVGQNAAANKVDYYAHRTINYKATVQPSGRVQASASVALKNGAPAAGLPRTVSGPYGTLPDVPGLNRSYLSLYLPGNRGGLMARVDGKPVDFESHKELGLGIVSRFLEVQPGKTSEMSLDLNPSIGTKGQYRLSVQRQPSLRPDDFHLSVRLPQGAVVKRMTPGMTLVGGGVQWRGRLTSDREFFVEYGSSVRDRLEYRLKRLVT